MKKLLISAAAVAALAGVAAPAAAQSWMSINQRQAELDRRIDMGVRNGDLTNREAVQLRSEFTTLARLESDYRRSGRGLDARERADLDRRFDSLSARIRFERNDGQDRNWENINQRQAELDRRIDAGVRSGDLTRREAAQLRTEFNTLLRLEADYRRSGRGLDARERADLDRRFDLLSARVRFERNDRQDRDDRNWQSINQRQANLDRRIDTAIRNRQLTLPEAVRLRAEFAVLNRLESTYRASGGGLDASERADLDRRFDALSARIRDYRRN